MMVAAGRRPLERLVDQTAEVDPAKAQDHVGLVDSGSRRGGELVERRRGVQRMVAWHHAAGFEVRQHGRAKPLGKRHTPVPVSLGPAAAAEEDQRPLRLREAARGIGQGHRVRHRRRRGRKARRIGQRGLPVELLLLQCRVEADVDRAVRRRVRCLPAAQDRLRQCRDRAGLVVPLDEVADQSALVLRGVQPVDPRPALRGVDRAGGAEDQHRDAIAPGVEDRHRAVHQSDVGVQRHRQRPPARLCITMRDGDGMLFVQAEQDLGPFVAQVIDQAVMQPAVTCAGIERDEGDAEAAEHLRGDVAAPADARVERLGRLFAAGVLPCRRRVATGALRLACQCHSRTSSRSLFRPTEQRSRL